MGDCFSRKRIKRIKAEEIRLTEIKPTQEHDLWRIRSALEGVQEEVKSVNQRLTEIQATQGHELQMIRENVELQLVNQRMFKTMASLEKQLNQVKCELKQKDEVKSVNKRLTETKSSHEKELQMMRSALEEKGEEVKSVNQRLTEMKAAHKHELQMMRTSLRQKEEELTSFKDRLQEATALRSSPQHCKPQGCEHKQSLTQMDMFYKKKLSEARSAAEQKEKELKSVKDRLAAQVAISLKTGNTESMNNPVSKTRLTEMYDNLKLLQWPKIKDRLKSRKIGPKEAKDLIQRTFGDAAEEMKNRKQQIEEIFQQTQSSSGPTPQKIKEYRTLTVQNLQMALFHTSKEDLLKTGFPGHGGPNSEEVEVDLRSLTSECFWLGCLMALNNPPLQPDWKNHVPGFDSWDVFPRDVKPTVE